jgi:hypothetical protein
MVRQHRRRLPLSSIDNNILRRSKRRKDAPSRSNETTEDDDDEHNNMRATVDGNVEEEVAGQMPESRIELEQCDQHLKEDVLAQATDESIEPEAEAPEEETEVEEACESLEVSGEDRAVNRASEPPVETQQSNPIRDGMMEAPEESELLGADDDDELMDDGLPDLSTLNLRCKVSVDSLFPMTRGKGKMRPPLNFLVSVGELLDWRAMTSQEQKASKALWVGLQRMRRPALKIPYLVLIVSAANEKRDATGDREEGGTL